MIVLLQHVTACYNVTQLHMVTGSQVDIQWATKLMQCLHDLDWWVNIGRPIDARPIHIVTVRRPQLRAFQPYIYWLGNSYSIWNYSKIKQGYSLHQFCCWYQGYTNQYEVYPPLALMISLILLGMLSINSWHCVTSILSHSTCTVYAPKAPIGLMWPNNTLPVLHSPVLMAESKV